MFVIVVDMQADFIRADGALPVPGAAALGERVEAWLGALDPAATQGVLFTHDTHDAATYADTAEAKLFPPHCLRGTPGWALVVDPGAVAPGIARYRLEKGVFDLWAEPGVVIEPIGAGEAVPREAFFDRLRASGVEEVAVVGVAADYCVRWAVEGLVARGFRVRVPAALTRGIERGMEAVLADAFAGGSVALV